FRGDEVDNEIEVPVVVETGDPARIDGARVGERPQQYEAGEEDQSQDAAQLHICSGNILREGCQLLDRRVLAPAPAGDARGTWGWPEALARRRRRDGGRRALARRVGVAPPRQSRAPDDRRRYSGRQSPATLSHVGAMRHQPEGN